MWWSCLACGWLRQLASASRPAVLLDLRRGKGSFNIPIKSFAFVTHDPNITSDSLTVVVGLIQTCSYIVLPPELPSCCPQGRPTLLLVLELQDSSSGCQKGDHCRSRPTSSLQCSLLGTSTIPPNLTEISLSQAPWAYLYGWWEIGPSFWSNREAHQGCKTIQAKPVYVLLTIFVVTSISWFKASTVGLFWASSSLLTYSLSILFCSIFSWIFWSCF